MALFWSDVWKEGPGIEKDTPPKTGLALFFEILTREFWQIVKLNLLFAVCAAPLVSFGAARAALSRCTMRMVRDEPNDVWEDFRQEIKKDLPRNTVFGLMELLYLGLSVAALSFPVVGRSAALCGLVCAALLFGCLFFGYLWPMLVTVEVPLGAAVKNAAALALLCPHHSLPALLCGAGLLGLSLWMFPLSLPLLLFVPFGLSSFLMSFAAWSDIRRLVLCKARGGA